MDYSDMSSERLQANISAQQDTIARAEMFRKEPGVGSSRYSSYTRTIAQARVWIAEWQAELDRRAADYIPAGKGWPQAPAWD